MVFFIYNALVVTVTLFESFVQMQTVPLELYSIKKQPLKLF